MAWDFAAEIHNLTGYDADDASGTATDGTALSLQADRWLVEGAKEVINQLPSNLKEKCMTFTNLTASAGTTRDMDGIGGVFHVTRKNGDSGNYAPCRKILAMYGDMSNDSGSMMHYASATDPVYWIDSNGSDAATLFVKPTPTDAQPAKAYHISYPSITCSDVSTIPNFPDEAEYLVVLYVAIKVLHNKMNEMNSNTAIDTGLTAATAALDQAEVAVNKFEAADADSIFGDESTFLTADSQLTYVKDALIKAQTLIDGATMGGDTEPQSAQYWLNEEDAEMVQATLQTAQSEIARASAEISHWTSMGDMRVKEIQSALQEADGYAKEVQTRMADLAQEYQWYNARYVALKTEYDQAFAIMAPPQQQAQPQRRARA